jgi:hypothetical protein
MSNVKNYTEQGGEKTVIGGSLEIAASGKLTIAEGATIEGILSVPVVDALDSTSATSALSAKQGKILNDAIAAKTAANQADSIATEVAELVTDFNALLAKLKAAGLKRRIPGHAGAMGSRKRSYCPGTGDKAPDGRMPDRNGKG